MVNALQFSYAWNELPYKSAAFFSQRKLMTAWSLRFCHTENISLDSTKQPITLYAVIQMKGTSILGQHLSVRSSSVHFLLVLYISWVKLWTQFDLLHLTNNFFKKSKYHIKYHSPSKGTKLKVVNIKFKIMETFLNMYHSTTIFKSCYGTDILKQWCSKLEKKNVYNVDLSMQN